MKILIISYHYPPVMNVGGMRALSWAKYWSEKGIDVTVLTGPKSGLKGKATSILSVAPNVKTYYIDSLHSRFQSEGDSSGSKVSLKSGIIKKIKFHAPVVDFDFQFIKKSYRRLKILESQGENFDYIVSTASPDSSHIVGLYAKKIFKCHWIADYRDLREQSADSPVFGPLREKALERYEKKVINNADIITTVSEDLSSVLLRKITEAHSSAKNKCVYNGYFDEMFSEVKKSSEKWRIVYTGSYYENQFEINSLFHALRKLKNDKRIPLPDLLFIGEERVIVKELLRELAKRNGINDPEFQNAVSLEQAVKIQLESSFLLLLDGMHNKGVLKTKSYEYLAARRPIIAIVNPDGELAKRFLNGYEGYVVGDNSDKIKSFIEEIYQLRVNNVDYQQREKLFIDPSVIENYSRRNQAMQLLDYMEKLS